MIDESNKRDCNCRNKNNLPLDGKCLTKCIVFEATVATVNNSYVYFGLADTIIVGTIITRSRFAQEGTNMIPNYQNIYGL